MLISNLMVIGQSKNVLYQNVDKVSAEHIAIELNLLNKKENLSKSYSDLIEDYDLFELNEASFLKLKKETATLIEIPISFRKKTIHVSLIKVDILSENYNLNTDKGLPKEQLSKKHFYQGIIKGINQSMVTLSVYDDELFISIHSEEGKYQIKKNTEKQYFGYYTQDILHKKSFDCAVEEKHKSNAKNNNLPTNRTGQDCVEIYYELDFEVYQDHGSNLAAVENWMTSNFNEVAAVYANEGIPISMSEMMVWTIPDPYVSINNISSVLNQFGNLLEDNYNGRIAHLISGRNLGGGIAWVDALCASHNPANNFGPYAVSANMSTGITPFPNFSWNVMNISHEMGHVFGSNHTHDCVWGPFNNNQIDDCGNVEFPNFAGSCYISSNPILPYEEGGTMMSYCHIVAGVDINFNNGFGAEPGALILGKYQNSTCITGENCPVVSPPINDDCINALQLPIYTTCEDQIFTNVAATNSGINVGLDCSDSGDELDVWFMVEIPATGNLIVETTQIPGGLEDMMIQSYSGSCESLIPISCSDDIDTANGERHARIEMTDFTPGEIIYIRVISWNSQTSGTFGICAYDPSAYANITLRCPNDTTYQAFGLFTCSAFIGDFPEPKFLAGGCSDLTYNYTPNEGSFFNNGTTEVELMAEDECGNFRVCTFNITVECIPCLDQLTINNNPIINNEYFANKAILSAGYIPSDGDILFSAGDSIMLNQNFETSLGAQFEIEIEGCN